ncbi:MAG: polyprenyl synthetase family protein [Nitrososphaerota archaeon]|nr:polyprenyl synthetase family protein [Nitrososphaerota archaeon]
MAASGMAGLDRYVKRVNSELLGLSFGRSTLGGPLRDALSGGGKRVRAVLALLWCEALSGSYEPAVPIAVAYELAHSAALVEDDIIDGSDTRRGKESVVGRYGLPNAILASNMLLFYVPKMVARYRRMPSERLCKLFDLVGECCRATTTGEFLDIQMAERTRVTEDDYERMIKLKTASLLAAPSASGAIVAGASDGEVTTAYRFGERIGMAYQVRDDLLDVMGSEEALGKPVFTDVREGKKSLVTLHALSRCSGEERRFMKGLFGRKSLEDGEVERMRQIARGYGSVEYCQKRALRYVGEAKALLRSARRSEARSRLFELCDYLSNRDY